MFHIERTIFLEKFKRDKEEKTKFLDELIYNLDKLYCDINSSLSNYFDDDTMKNYSYVTEQQKLIAIIGDEKFNELIKAYYKIFEFRQALQNKVRDFKKNIEE